MANEKHITLDDIYKSIKKHDEQILNNFNSNINDDDYFFNAINFDIFSNILSIIINIKMNNIESIGVDNNCRAILEAFLILKMRAKDEINNDQLKVFRNNYKIVDYYNLTEIYGETVYQEFPEKKREYDEAIEEVCKIYNIDKSKLKEKIISDPNLYLNKKYNKQPISFAKLMNEYKIFDEDDKKAYSFFSINIHPSCEINENIRNINLLLREELVKWILNISVHYMNECKLFVFDDKISSFNEDISNPILNNNIKSIEDVKQMFDSIIKKTCVFKDGIDGYSLNYFRMLKHAFVDLLIHQSLGYCEQVTNKFKSIIEYIAIHALINSKEKKEFYILREMYLFSSRMQYGCYYKEFGIEEQLIDEKVMKSHYDNYYKNKYDIDSFEQFKCKLEKNSRYFIAEKNNSYKKIVNDFINEHFSNTIYKDELKLLYLISLDSEHAGGYIYNSNNGLWELMPHIVVDSLFTYLKYLLLNIELSSVDENINIKFDNEYKLIEVIQYNSKYNIKKCSEKYSSLFKDKYKNII